MKRISALIQDPQDFPGGAVDENLPANAGDMGLTHGLGRFLMLWTKEAPGPQLLMPGHLEPVLHERPPQ